MSTSYLQFLYARTRRKSSAKLTTRKCMPKSVGCCTWIMINMHLSRYMQSGCVQWHEQFTKSEWIMCEFCILVHTGWLFSGCSSKRTYMFPQFYLQQGRLYINSMNSAQNTMLHSHNALHLDIKCWGEFQRWKKCSQNYLSVALTDGMLMEEPKFKQLLNKDFGFA